MSEVMIKAQDGSMQMQFLLERGGMATSICVEDPAFPEGRELLYLPDHFDPERPQHILGGWPLCFPICGRLQREGEEGVYLFQGKRYSLPIHGFACDLPWEMLEKHDDAISIRLQATAETKTQYPFDFELILFYRLAAGVLHCQQTVVNHGSNAMPFDFGFHPYFYIDPEHYDKSSVYIECEPQYRYRLNAALMDVVGTESTPVFPAAISQPEVNECLMSVNNPLARLAFPDGSAIEMTGQSINGEHIFDILNCYYIPEAPFFCVESWTGCVNALNTIDGPMWLAAGAKHQSVYEVRYQPSC